MGKLMLYFDVDTEADEGRGVPAVRIGSTVESYRLALYSTNEGRTLLRLVDSDDRPLHFWIEVSPEAVLSIRSEVPTLTH